MKKVLLGSIILNIIGILFIGFIFINNNEVKNIKKDIKQKEALETIIGKINKAKVTKEDCEDVINGKKVNSIKNTFVYMRYIDLKKINLFGGEKINGIIKEYYNLVGGQCDLVNEKNIQFCKDFKNKKISKDYNYTDYEVHLLKSLINKENYCSEIRDDQKIFECNDFYTNINNLDNPVFPTNLNVSKKLFYFFYKIKGEDIYNKELDNLFLKNCKEIYN